jgi:hypothetical protein
MRPSDAATLTPESPVWIWIIRQGKGEWCPGKVQRVATRQGATSVTVKFECHSLLRSRLLRSRSRATSFMGISTTQARYLERRELRRLGNDQPQCAPALLIGPEASTFEQEP